MGWEEYYQIEDIISLNESLLIYQKAIDYLQSFNPELLDPQTDKVFVLGGFTHQNSTASDFLDFCRELHPHPQTIILDLHSQPLTNTKATPDVKVQTDLTSPPFKPESIDVLFLDLTLNFMSDQQLQDFFKNITPALKPNGLILTNCNEPAISKFLEDIIGSLKNKTKYQTLGKKQLDYSKPYLKKVYSFFESPHTLNAFSPPDSIYPRHIGRPYCQA